MNLRTTQFSTFAAVTRGIEASQAKLALLQLQVSTGKRILKPSDDASGAALSMSLRRRMSSIDADRTSILASRQVLDASTAELQQASTLIADARALVVQALNGTLSHSDRQTLAEQIELARDSLLEISNARFGDRFLFAGTETGSEPFVEVGNGSSGRVEYRGNDHEISIRIGPGEQFRTNIGGEQIFGRRQPSGPVFSGTTGVATGTSASAGRGYATLDFRHETTSGALPTGLAFVSGGSLDTILGDHTLAVDVAAGTVRLGDGPLATLPGPGATDLADFRIVDADGGELHLDFSAWTPTDFSGTVRGDGSVSLDGTAYFALSFTETDLRLEDPSTGALLHLDTTAVGRAGQELVTFGGTTNVFDTLSGIADDLRAGLSSTDLGQRVAGRLDELDRHHANLLEGLGRLGARTERLDNVDGRLQDALVSVEGRISTNEDVDLTQAVLELTRAETALQAAQATGARLIQQSLLNYLR